jgi:hypothetical protein
MIDDPQVNDAPTDGTISGRAVVLAMFGFGILVVGTMYLYWDLYTRPFRALQNAIAAEFPGSSPRAIGGRHKSHKEGSPETLRIIVRVDFDPQADEQRSQAHAQRLAEIAAAHHDVSRYELLEVHLIHRQPEQDTQHWSMSRPVAEWGLRLDSQR